MTDLNRRSFFQLLGAAVAVATTPVIVHAAIPAAPPAPSPGDIEVLIDGAWKRLGKAINVNFTSVADYREMPVLGGGYVPMKGMIDERGEIVFDGGKFGDFDSGLANTVFLERGRVPLRAHMGGADAIEVNVMMVSLVSSGGFSGPPDRIHTETVGLVVVH